MSTKLARSQERRPSKKTLAAAQTFEPIALSIFEQPMHSSVMIRHISRAMNHMAVVVECVWTTEQAELAIKIGQDMARLAKMR